MVLKKENDNETYVVRCRGLPWSVTKDEIAEFFDSCELAGERESSIILTKNRDGRLSGEGYVMLARQEDLNEALKKDKANMGKRYVEVFTTTYDEMKRDMDRSGFQAQNNDNVVKLRGLPWESSKEDILKFFEGIQIGPNCIMLGNNSMGRSSGEAFVQFSSKKDLQEAMKREKQNIGARYIEIFPSSLNEAFNGKLFSMAQSQGIRRPRPYDRSSTYGDGIGRNIKGLFNRPNFSLMGMGNVAGMVQDMGANGHLIRMRGLPFSVTEMEVAKWFSPVAEPIHVAIDYKNGSPSGNARVYFKSAKDAKSAMSKNKQNMQHRYIELFNEGSSLGKGQDHKSFALGKEFLMGSGLENTEMGGNMINELIWRLLK